jgi:hypothetical protein
MATFDLTTSGGRLIWQSSNIAGTVTRPSNKWHGYEWYWRRNVGLSLPPGDTYTLCVTLKMPEGYTFGDKGAISKRCAGIHN